MIDKDKHLHIYERIRGKGGANTRYRCIHPDCTHYILAELLGGKRALCSICKTNEIKISDEDLRRKHFRCADCSNTKAAVEAREKQKKINSILSKALNQDEEDWFRATPKEDEVTITIEDILNEG